ncbi:MAG: hypothetical protein QM715_12425 [Nibricoccus sp.]
MKRNQALPTDQALDACIAEIATHQEAYLQQRKEYRAALTMEPKLVQDIERRQASCKLGDMQEAREICIAKEALLNVRKRAATLTPNPSDDLNIWRARWDRALPLVRPEGYRLLERMRAEFTAKLVPIIGADDAGKLVESLTPVQLLGETLRVGFLIPGEPDSYREACIRMMELIRAMRSDGFDAHKWSKGEHRLIRFLPSKSAQSEPALTQALVEVPAADEEAESEQPE